MGTQQLFRPLRYRLWAGVLLRGHEWAWFTPRRWIYKICQLEARREPGQAQQPALEGRHLVRRTNPVQEATPQDATCING